MNTQENRAAAQKRIRAIRAIWPERKITGLVGPAYFPTVARLLMVFGTAIGAMLGTAMTSAAPQGATPWAVIKCKFSDQPQEPAFDPAFITANDGMAGYWQAVSYGRVSLDGSAIYGWYILPFTLAEGQQMNPVRRGRLID